VTKCPYEADVKTFLAGAYLRHRSGLSVSPLMRPNEAPAKKINPRPLRMGI